MSADVQNPTIALLSARRSTPAIACAEPGPTPEQLDLILTLGARVPDHGKLAPWRFIVIEGEAREALDARLAAALKASDPDIGPGRLAQQASQFSQSALVIGVVSRAGPHVKIPEWEQVLSAGAVCMNVVTAANALGFGAQWLTGWAAYAPEALAILGVGDSEKVAGFIHIGTPTQTLPDRPRPELSDVVTRWGA